MSQETTTESLAALRERTARAEAALAAAQQELDALRAAGPDISVLDHLATTLHWDGAPYSLRLVLPLARAIRWLAGGLSGRAYRALAPAAPAPAGGPPPPRRSLARRIAIAGYRIVRPVLLPLLMPLHRLLSRLVERESPPAPRAGVSGDAALLRSIEVAMLTLALQRRDDRR